jgi:hypothetical protein
MGILESKREQIIGCDELLHFGAAIRSMDPPQRIIGIKRGKPDKVSSSSSKSWENYGLIRRPSSLKGSIGARLMSVDGLVPNAALAIAHFMLILAVPSMFPIIFFLALSEMTTL